MTANLNFQSVGKSLIHWAPRLVLAESDRAGSGALLKRTRDSQPKGCVSLQSRTETTSMSTELMFRAMRADPSPWLRGNWARRSSAFAGLLAAVAIATIGAPPSMLPAAQASPGQHTVVYRILGGGDVFSVIPDPGTPVYPSSTTTWVSTPWSQPCR